jgi:Uma2 family endonuclease
MAAAAPQTKHWTYEDYYKLDDERRYEVISGELLMAPAPDTWHQNWINNLTLLITPFVRLKKLGTVFVAPLDVVLNEENVVQPDLVFVSSSNSGIIEKRGVFGTPDLLVEMISPSSVRRDRYQKKELYARFGVKEYWIGDPANKSMEVLTLKGNAFELHCSAEEKGKVTSLVLAGFQFDIAELG